MSGLLSLTTFAPLAGVAVILAARAINGASEKTDTLAKWIALVTTLVTFGLSIVLTLQFDPKNPGFQFVEDVSWFAGLHYRMGVDGISVLFVLLTAFLLPICIVASWKSVEKRVSPTDWPLTLRFRFWSGSPLATKAQSGCEPSAKLAMPLTGLQDVLLRTGSTKIAYDRKASCGTSTPPSRIRYCASSAIDRYSERVDV